MKNNEIPEQHKSYIHTTDLTRINTAVVNGRLQIKHFEWYAQFDDNTIRYFMFKNGFYVLPTAELIAFLAENITGRAIEICAGNGAIGRALGIPITDSHIQSSAEMKKYMASIGQPTITYPPDVEKYTARQALVKFKPDTVIGAFVTHKFEPGMIDGSQQGVRENDLLNAVKRYILIGNLVTHQNKPLLQLPHRSYSPYWLITRGIQPRFNQIWIWDNPHVPNQ